MLAYIFWNGIYCKRVNPLECGPIWILESLLTGERYRVHYFDVELAQFNTKRKATK